MLRFVLRRLIVMVPLVLLVLTITFFMVNLAPGSPFSKERALSPEIEANLNAKYGFDQPRAVQYARFMCRMIGFTYNTETQSYSWHPYPDFGDSTKYKDRRVNDIIKEALPVSAVLGLTAYLIALVVGLTSGILSSLKQNSWLDYSTMSGAMLGVSIPNFVLGPLLVIVFSLGLYWLPPARMEWAAEWGYLRVPTLRTLILPERDLRGIRGGQIAMIFQDPMTSLNPFIRVSTQLMEMTELHLGHTKKQAYEHAVEMLELVGIPDARSRVGDYPHQFSGGMRQRVMIAMALSCRPKLLIADEPTTALDVTIQAQILELIKKLKQETGTSVILITHDLGVVAGMTDHIIVMYAGHIFESATTAELFRNPQNPYTRALLRSVPDPTREGEELFQIPGLPPDLARLAPDRCPFAERCPEAIDKCLEAFHPYHRVDEGHWTLCWVR